MTNNVIAAVILGGAIIAGGFFSAQQDVIITGGQAPFGTIQVGGSASAKAIPDTSIIRAGVQVNQAATQEDGYSQMNKSINAIQLILEDAGIDKKSIQSTNLNVSQQFSYEEGKQTPNGYNASQMLSIRIEKKDESVANDILDKITKVENIQIQGINFELSDTESVRSEARKKALENARKKADEIAAATGVKIKQVLSVTEDIVQDYPIPMFANTRMESMSDDSISDESQISTGELEYTISVNVSYQIQ